MPVLTFYKLSESLTMARPSLLAHSDLEVLNKSLDLFLDSLPFDLPEHLKRLSLRKRFSWPDRCWLLPARRTFLLDQIRLDSPASTLRCGRVEGCRSFKRPSISKLVQQICSWLRRSVNGLNSSGQLTFQWNDYS